MPRGVKTPPALRERAIATVIIEGTYAAAARKLNMAPQTIANLAETTDEFSEVRALVERQFIIDTWEQLKMTTSLYRMKADQLMENDGKQLKFVSIVELSTAMRNLAVIVQNVGKVVQDTMALNLTLNTSNQVDLADVEEGSYWFFEQKTGLTRAQINEKLGV